MKSNQTTLGTGSEDVETAYEYNFLDSVEAQTMRRKSSKEFNVE